jgi:hypothetical protein
LDDQHGEALVDIVVKVSRNAPAFFFLHGQEAGGEVAKLLPACGEGLFAVAKVPFGLNVFGYFLQERVIDIGKFLRSGLDSLLQFTLGLAELNLCPLALLQEHRGDPDDDQAEDAIADTDPQRDRFVLRANGRANDNQRRRGDRGKERQPRIGRSGGQDDDPGIQHAHGDAER